MALLSKHTPKPMSETESAVKAMEQLAAMGFCVVWSVMPNGQHRIAIGDNRQGKPVVSADGGSLPQAFDRALTQIEELERIAKSEGAQ